MMRIHNVAIRLESNKPKEELPRSSCKAAQAVRSTTSTNGESALMAEADEEGRITRAYGFNPHTQQARTNEEGKDAKEGL